MTEQETVRKVKRVFIASPVDLAKERKRFPDILEKLNRLKAHAMGFDLKPLGWEDALPGKGRPQEVINKDVEQCDLFVMLLWNRWGTPPGGSSAYTSGTEEEFELARKLDKQIFLYFRDVLEEMLADAGPELERVLGFRKKIEAEKQLLFSRYRAPTQWDEQVMEHIARWLDGFQPIPSSPSARIPPEVQARISEL